MRRRFRIGSILMFTMVMVFAKVLPVLAAETAGLSLERLLPQGVLSALGAVLGLILVDTILGILLSLKAGFFGFRKLPQFLETNVLPYIGGLIVLSLAASISVEMSALFYAAAATTSAKFLAEIKDKIVEVFGKDRINDSQ